MSALKERRSHNENQLRFVIVVRPVESRQEAPPELSRAVKDGGKDQARFERTRADVRRCESVIEAKTLVADLLENGFEDYGSMDLRHLLVSIPTWGPSRVERVCERAGVSYMAKIREITPGRREALVRILRDQRGSN